MVTLQDFLKSVTPRICGGTEHCWKCYGPNAWYLDFGPTPEKVIADVVYDVCTQRIYQINFFDELNEDITHVFIWIDPEYSEAHDSEAAKRNIKEDSSEGWLNYRVDDVDSLIRRVGEAVK